MASPGAKEESDANDDAIDIFQEPQGYYQPNKPSKFTEFELQDGRIISLRLVGESPLWVRQ